MRTTPTAAAPSWPSPFRFPAAIARPVLGTFPESITGQEGTAISFPLSITDPDGDPLAVYADNVPPGAAVDSSGLRFTWTPDFDSAGTYQDVTFHFNDGVNDVTAKVTFFIAPTPQPLVFVAPADRTIREGDHLRFYLSSYDPDGGTVAFHSFLMPPGIRSIRPLACSIGRPTITWRARTMCRSFSAMPHSKLPRP